MTKEIMCIFDTQVKEGIDTTYLSDIGKYIVEKRPDIVVHIGDHWDMPSLSSYDVGKKVFEGRRYRKDIDAGNQGMQKILTPLMQLQNRQRANKEKIYK
jgi:hypothetical protein